MALVQTGLENFLESPPRWIRNHRLGLLCNPASVNRNFHHARYLINKIFPGRLSALFSPQHGFYAEKQDNMIESGHITDPVLNIPVFSLYGQTRKPLKEMFDPIDILLIDLQDAGTRVYTFMYTMSYCLEAAAAFNKRVIVLDRPNPINGRVVEGNCLSPDCVSFVGRFPLPMRHGLTMGELALLFNKGFDIGCELEVWPMKGWNRDMYFKDTGLPWIPPSPNLPTPLSAMVYPGQVLLEGTNVSEGRGTTQPFELFGSPFLNTRKFFKQAGPAEFPGVFLREVLFEPTSNKWADQTCFGFHIHVIDPVSYQPYKTSLKLLQVIMQNHGDRFRWTSPPYEYEYVKQPFDLIVGSNKIRKQLESGEDIDQMVHAWEKDLMDFKKMSGLYYLYPNGSNDPSGCLDRMSDCEGDFGKQ